MANDKAFFAIVNEKINNDQIVKALAEKLISAQISSYLQTPNPTVFMREKSGETLTPIVDWFLSYFNQFVCKNLSSAGKIYVNNLREQYNKYSVDEGKESQFKSSKAFHLNLYSNIPDEFFSSKAIIRKRDDGRPLKDSIGAYWCIKPDILAPIITKYQVKYLGYNPQDTVENDEYDIMPVLA
jgi:hypothetical protein